jgi:hypothetical protein
MRLFGVASVYHPENVFWGHTHVEQVSYAQWLTFIVVSDVSRWPRNCLDGRWNVLLWSVVRGSVSVDESGHFDQG